MKKLRYIIEYLLFLLIFKLLRFTSVDRAAHICSKVVRYIGPYLPVTKIALQNIQNVYLDAKEAKYILDGALDNFGRFIGELPFFNVTDLNDRVHLNGLDNIELLQKQNKPFILFMCHQANWEIAIRKAHLLYPKLGIIYRKINNPYINKIILQHRTYHSSEIIMIEKGARGVKNLLFAIANKYSLLMLVDQKMNNGIEVPFFDIPAMTTYGIAKISLKYDYPLVPLQIIRKSNNTDFDVIIHKPLTFVKSKSSKHGYYQIMLVINKIIETWIRQHPSQWFWFHNRWKKNNSITQTSPKSALK
jgi:KDO2-lipid IV(A) lauroyltransferase